MDVKSKYNELVKNHVAPLLVDNGLTKSSSSYFFIKNELLLRSLTLEKDKFNYPGRYSFRIVIGIEGLINPLKRDTEADDSIVSANQIPVLAISISEIAGRKLIAYTIDDSTVIEEYASTIIDDIKKYALPILHNTDNIETLEKLLNDLKTQTGLDRYFFTMAIFLANLNMKDKSKEYFIKSSGSRDVIVNTAAFYGINLSDRR